MNRIPGPRLTLMAARTSKVQDQLDALIDARPVSAAATIRRMDEDDVKVLLFAAVSSVGERYRFPSGPTATPEAKADAVAERTRRVLRDILAENPETILPTIRALSDAVATFDPRRSIHDQDRDEAA